jgi:hypothetical protein
MVRAAGAGGKRRDPEDHSQHHADTDREFQMLTHGALICMRRGQLETGP